MASLKLNGDTSGSITISSPAVAGSNTLTLPKTTQTLATENALGVRNLVINGDMRFAQRGTSFTGKTSGNTFGADRFKTQLGTAGTWTISQDTDVPTGQGFSKSYKMDCTTANASLSAGSYGIFVHRMEGQMLQHLKKGTSSAEQTTLSFWVKSNKTGTYQVNLRDNDNSRLVGSEYTISSANTWEKKTITFAGDTSGALDNDNAHSLQIEYWFVAGSTYSGGTAPSAWEASNNSDRAANVVNLADSTSNYINFTGIQLEIGDTATPFEHRPYDTELVRCQRYYEKSYNDGTAVGTATTGHTQGVQGAQGQTTTSAVGSYINFTVQKRTTPTITTYDSAGNSGKVDRVEFGTATVSNFTSNVYEAGDKGFIAYSTSGSKAAHSVRTHYTAESEL